MYEFSTKDVGETAYFMLFQDIDFAGFNRQTVPGRTKPVIYFKFKSELSQSEIDKRKCEYVSNKALVDPKAYGQKMLEVRNLLREELGN